MGHVTLGMLGICVCFWSLARAFTLGCVLGLGTIILGCILSLSHCSMPVSICPGCFSVITDVFSDYLTGFHNILYIVKRLVPLHNYLLQMFRHIMCLNTKVIGFYSRTTLD